MNNTENFHNQVLLYFIKDMEQKLKKKRIKYSGEKVNIVMYVCNFSLACNFLPRGNN